MGLVGVAEAVSHAAPIFVIDGAIVSKMAAEFVSVINLWSILAFQLVAY